MSIRTYQQGIRVEPTTNPPSNPVDMQLWASDGLGSYAKEYWRYDLDTTSWVSLGGGGGGLDTFTTVALAEAATGYSEPDLIYVVETESFYRYESNSSETDDNTFILSTNDGGTTRWIAVGGKYIFGTINTQSIDTDNLVVGSPAAYDLLQYNGTTFTSQYLEDSYIRNSKALYDTTSWTAYKNTTSAATPEITPGGAPSGNLALTRTTTAGEVLDGIASFKIAKTGSTSVQGEGYYYDFVVPRGYASKPHFLSFLYQVTSNFSYVNNDVKAFISDQDADVIVPLTPDIFDGSGSYKGEFQANANTSTNYRLYIHFTTTSALNFDFIFDNVVVANSKGVVTGTPSTDWTEFTPTTEGFGTISSAKFYKRRVGDSVQYMGWFTTGTCTATAAKITDTSVTFDKIGIDGDYTPIGILYKDGTSNIDWIINTYSNGSNKSLFFGIRNNGSAQDACQAVDGNAQFEDSTEYRFHTNFIPVAGWSSNVVLSDGADTRVNTTIYSSSNGQTISSGGTVIYETKVKDTHSSYNSSTGEFTTQIAGDYRIGAQLKYTAVTSDTIQLQYKPVGGSYSIVKSFRLGDQTDFFLNTALPLNVGDMLKITMGVGGTLSSNASANGIFIIRESGPATIAASEKVIVNYVATGGNSLIDGTFTTVIFPTKIKDTHGMIESDGKIRLKRNGSFFIDVWIWLENNPTNASMKVLKNGIASPRYMDFLTPAIPQMQRVSGILTGVTGDYFELQLYHNYGSTLNVSSGDSRTRLSIFNID